MSEAAGPLSVQPANPRYFVDSNGKAVYLTGAHLSNNLIDRSDKAAFDFTAYLDILQQHNHNFIRLWAWEQAAWSADSVVKVEFDPLPYERTGPGTALDGDPRFDLTRFNQAYFDRLRSRVQAAGERGIYVSVMLFQGFNGQRKTRQASPWSGHPFNAANNINAIDGDQAGTGGAAVHSLTAPSILALQETYVRKVVDTLNDLDNVLYEISGESPSGSADWQEHMVNYLKAYQSAKANQHPVGVSYFYRGRGELPSAADWILSLATSATPAVAAEDRPVLLHMDSRLLRLRTADQWVWKSFTRGYNSIYQETDLSDLNGSVAQALGQAQGYSEIVDLSALSPSDTLCSTRYCLVNPGVEYLVYAPSGGRINADLSGANGSFLLSWYNPATGQTVAGGTVSAGAWRSFTTPWAGEALLHIVSQSVSSGQGSATSYDFNLSNGGGVSVGQGSSAAVTINATSASLASAAVSFSVSGLPQGATGSFSKQSCAPSCSSLMTIQTAVSTPIGSFTIAVKGQNSQTEKTTSFNLTVTAPSVKAPTETVFAPTISPDGGEYTDSVLVALQTSTSGGSIYYTTDGTSPTQSSQQYAAPFSVSTTTLVKAKAFKEGANPSAESSAWFSKKDHFDFSTANTGNKAVVAGSSVTNVISVSLASGSAQTVSFSVSGLPTGASASFSSASCSPSCSSTLTVNTSSSTPAGNYPVSVRVTAGSLTKTTSFSLVVSWPTAAAPAFSPDGGSFTGSVSVTLQTATSGASIYYTTNGTTPTQSSTLYSGAITLSSSATVKAIAVKTGYNPSAVASASFTVTQPFDFSLADTGNKSVTAGSSVTNAISVSLVSGSAQAVSFSVSGLPTGASASFSSATCSPSCSSTLTINTSSSTPAGSFTVTPRATAGSLTKTTSFTLTVSLPTAAAPTFSPNGGSFSGSVSVILQTATSGASIYYTTNGTTPTASSTLYSGAITLSSSATVKAIAVKTGYNPSTVASAAFTVTQPFDFSLANSGDKSVTAGSSTTNAVSTSLVSGSAQAVSFSVSGLPTGASASFSSTSCSPSCSSTLTINTSSSTPAGSFTVTPRATAGSLTKTTSFTLTVSWPTAAAPTFSPNGGSFSGSVSVSLQTATSGASIYYTTNGTTPTASSTLYSGAVTLSTSATVKAIAVKAGHNSSAVASAAFTITAPQPSQLTLTWEDKSNNEDNFKIERKTGAGGVYAQIASLGANVVSYVNTGLVKGTTYCYRVQAANSAGASTYTNEACAVAP